MKSYFFRHLFAACLAASVATSALAADSCRFLSKFVLEDGQVFANGLSGWQKFDSLSDLVVRSEDTEFAYVIRVPENTERKGVLLVKTNRPETADDQDDVRKRVRLQRREITQDIGCKAIVGDADSDVNVSTDAFRDYHDFSPRATPALRRTNGYGETEATTLKSFHFEYKSDRKRRCIRTDSDDYDRFPLNTNSNRAQFSFDRTVVAGGSYSVARLFFWVPTSAFDGYSDHRVTMRKYETSSSVACVRFKVPIASRNYTFQINDLESRPAESSFDRKPQITR